MLFPIVMLSNTAGKYMTSICRWSTRVMRTRHSQTGELKSIPAAAQDSLATTFAGNAPHFLLGCEDTEPLVQEQVSPESFVSREARDHFCH